MCMVQTVLGAKPLLPNASILYRAVKSNKSPRPVKREAGDKVKEATDKPRKTADKPKEAADKPKRAANRRPEVQKDALG